MEDGFDAAARQIRGSIKEAIGMLIGDPVVEAEGVTEKAAGLARGKVYPKGDDAAKS